MSTLWRSRGDRRGQAHYTGVGGGDQFSTIDNLHNRNCEFRKTAIVRLDFVPINPLHLFVTIFVLCSGTPCIYVHIFQLVCCVP